MNPSASEQYEALCAEVWRQRDAMTKTEPLSESDEQLLRAAQAGDLMLLENALARGASIEARDKNGNTVLHVAAEHNQLDCLDRLIAEGAVVDAINHKSVTPLMIAAEREAADCVERLLAAGASVEARSEYCVTALIHSNNVRCTDALIKAGADVDACSFSGLTHLMMASIKGQDDIIRRLSLAGATLHLQDKGGRTAAMWAVIESRDESLLALVEAGVDLEREMLSGKALLQHVLDGRWADVLSAWERQRLRQPLRSGTHKDRHNTAGRGL